MDFLKKLPFLRKSGTEHKQRRERLMEAFLRKYANFKTLLESNTELLGIISDIEQKLRGQTVFGPAYIEAQTMRTIFHSARMVHCLEKMADRPFPALKRALEEIQGRMELDSGDIAGLQPDNRTEFIAPYQAIAKDSVDLVGAKNANLGEARNRLGIATPKGFAITTAAFRHFIEANQLTPTILRMKAKADIIEAETILQVGQEIQRHILAAEVPPDLAQAILTARERLCDEIGADACTNLSMRSSALGEDSTLSFAGQYLTLLNVRPQEILEAYKKIIASLFTPHAISYRLHMGITFQEAVMAVACQEMITARASGVMYTRNPVNPLENRILIKAVWGLGPYAVDGVVPPDTYSLAKEDPPRLLQTVVAEKGSRLIALPGGNVVDESVPQDQCQAACLSEEQALQLAAVGMRLESHFGQPQDVEWALDGRNRLVILQARPLRVDVHETGGLKMRPDPVQGHPILLEGGDIGCVGVGCGPVFKVATEKDLADFPDGAVLVCASSSAQLVMAMPKARAILTDSGNIAGHMSSLAREYMIPTILNLQQATRVLEPGVVVTVDAFNARVYQGHVAELTASGFQISGVMHSTQTYQRLRRRANLIVPLNLTDPKSPGFKAEACKTIHDIMRFVHEKSYEEIFQLGDLITDRGQLSVRLNAGLPLDLYVIDLGGGLRTDAHEATQIVPADVLSQPFSALLEGMMHDALRAHEPRPIHLGGFFSVMSRQLLTPPNLAAERFGDRSYAIISDRYLNFSSRVGYHYSILDSYCGQTAAKNYINFQFKGGAADDARRNRRARVIEKILASEGFLVDTLGDRVTARIGKKEAAVIRAKLEMIGRLLIFTRQMDMLMHHDTLVTTMAECFLSGNYGLDPDAPSNCAIKTG